MKPCFFLSTVLSFFFIPFVYGILDTPLLRTPVNHGALYTQLPSPYWTDSQGKQITAYSSNEFWQIQIATNRTFSNTLVDDTIGIGRYVVPSLLPGGLNHTYYWRVRKIQGANVGAFSAVFDFYLLSSANVFNIPDGSSLLYVSNIFANALAQGPNTLVNFAQGGTYQFDSSEDYCFLIAGATDLKIHGNGAKITLNNPASGFLKLLNSTNVQICSFVLDMNPLPYSVGTVIPTNNGGFLVDKLSAVYPDFDAPHMKAHWLFGSLLDPHIDGRLKTGVKNRFSIKSPGNGGVFSHFGNRFCLEFGAMGDSNAFSKGDRFIQFARPGNGLFFSYQSSNIAFHNNTSYASVGPHYQSIGGSDLKVIACQALIHSNRVYSGNADGVYAQSNPIGPWVEGCTFNGLGDDGVALFNKGMFLLEKVNGGSVRISNYGFHLKSGDLFTFWNPRSGSVMTNDSGTTSQTVSSVSYRASEAGYGSHYVVNFTPIISLPLMTTSGSPLTNDQAFSLSERNAYFAIRKNTFKNIRRYGNNIRAAFGVIENNTFEGTSSCAITLRNECPGAGNGLYSYQVTIRSNYIKDCGRDSYFMNNASIEVTLANISNQLSTWPGQNSILIENNHITNFEKCAISVNCAHNAIVRNNLISSDLSAFLLPEKPVVIIGNQTQFQVITNNTVREKRVISQWLVLSNSTSFQTNGNSIYLQ